MRSIKKYSQASSVMLNLDYVKESPGVVKTLLNYNVSWLMMFTKQVTKTTLW